MERTVKADQVVSYTLVCAVAEFEGCCPTNLPPLHDTLDVDALNSLFSSETDKTSQFEGNIIFEYSGSSVTIGSDRSVTISIPS